jgi:small subunit ribosomal protein S2
MVEQIMKELIEAGVHFGHQTSRWNPKMRRFIFGQKAGVYIVDLEKTVKGLEEARNFLRTVAAQGGPILFVGTKRQAQSIIKEEAERCGQFYINLRWLGGLLTNFQTIQKSIDRLRKIRTEREDGTFERITKKEAAMREAELGKLEKNLSGILDMGRLPKAIYVIDAKREETTIKEATRLGIPLVGLVDTNSDPDPISYVIPGNDDSIRSIRLITSLLADSILEGRQAYLANKAAEEAARKDEQNRRDQQAKDEEALREKQKQAAEAAAAGAPIEAVPAPDPVEEIVPPSALKVAEDAAAAARRKKAVKKPETTT